MYYNEPVIDALSLQFDGGERRIAQIGTFSYVNFVSGEASVSVSFSGIFGEFPEEVNVRWRDRTGDFELTCQVDPDRTTNTNVK